MANNLLKQLDSWHQTLRGLLTFSLIELILAYIVGSRAIDTGSLIEYTLTIILLVGGIRNIYKLLNHLVHGNKRKAKGA